MSKVVRDHLRSNVVGYVAVFIALSGVAYAAGGEIGSKDIINGQVKTADVGNNQIRGVDVRDDTLKNGGLAAADLGPDSVTGSEIAPDSVTGSELAPSSVGGSELAPGSVGFEALLPGSVRSATVQDDSLGGADIDESTLGIVPEAEQVGGATMCRTDGPVSVGMTVFGPFPIVPILDCGPFSFTARCGSTPPTTPPNYPIRGDLFLVSSLDDSFGVGTGGDPDLDSGEAMLPLSVTSPASNSGKAVSMSPIAAGNLAGAIQLTGVAAVSVTAPSNASATDGHCDFVVGAAE